MAKHFESLTTIPGVVLWFSIPWISDSMPMLNLISPINPTIVYAKTTLDSYEDGKSP